MQAPFCSEVIALPLLRHPCPRNVWNLAHPAEDFGQGFVLPQIRLGEGTNLTTLVRGDADYDRIPVAIVVCHDQQGARGRDQFRARHFQRDPTSPLDGK